MEPIFTVTQRRKVPVISFNQPLKPGHTVSILLQFDEHWDNPHSSQSLNREHMQQAVDKGLPIIKGGDSLCLMQGRYDPRRARNDIRPEHDHPDYIDRIVSSYAAFCEFAAKNIAFMGRGNHELSILRHLETDVIERVGERLRAAGSPVITGGIGGWILVKVPITKTASVSMPIFYTHGYGGGGPVTKGVIQTNRRAAVYGDAQVIISGHIHEDWKVKLVRDRINTHTGRTYLDEQLHICSPTYKQEYDPPGSSWHSQGGRNPKPIGATWLDLTMMRDNSGEDQRPNRSTKSTLPMYRLHAEGRSAI